MNHEQMIAWLTLEGYEFFHYRNGDTIYFRPCWLIRRGDTEWLRYLDVEDDEWSSLPTSPDQWESPIPGSDIPEAHLQEFMEAIREP